MGRKAELGALLGLAAWVAVFWRGPLINDVGWQLWVGGQLNAGARLYVDILEVNPPLWFWINALVDRGADVTQLGGLQTLLLLLAGCALVSLLLCTRLVADPRQRSMLYASLVLSLFLTSPYALGQREQFVLITVLPYIALIARRFEGRPVNRGLFVTVVLWAALGLALKHYFALVPLALEIWRWRRGRKVRLSPEIVGLAVAGAAYGTAILLLTPEYLRTMVPLIRTAYHGYDESLLEQLQQPALFAALFAIAAVALRRDQVPPLAQAAAVAAGAFAAVYLLQGKAFHYHAVPALGAALVAVLVGFGSKLRGPGMAAGALALGAAAATPIVAGPARFDQPARAVTANIPAGTPIVAITASGVAAWPTVEERNLRWPSRHMTLWMLPSIWQAEQRGEIRLELERLARAVRAEVAAEIACSGAALVLVDRRYDQMIREGDLLAFMSRDPAFAHAMQAYQRQPDAGYLRVYRRREPPAKEADCRRPQLAI